MNFDQVSQHLQAIDPVEGLRWVHQQFGNTATFSTSLGLEDQVITSLIARHKLSIEIFTLDTGRLFQESYDLLDETRSQYQIEITSYFPDTKAVEALVTTKGSNSFYQSIENRKECCHIRKIEPLKRALHSAKIWITGLRAEQSANRGNMQRVEWDSQFQIIKYNPLLHWSLADVEDFIRDRRVPVNTLHRKGYASIGCAPCTRAIMPGEDIRAGRWWWESSGKECGLHAEAMKQTNYVKQ